MGPRRESVVSLVRGRRRALLLAGALTLLWLPSAHAGNRISVSLSNSSGYDVSFYFKVGQYAPARYRLDNGRSGTYYMSRGRTTISIGQTRGQVTQSIRTPGRYEIYYNPGLQQIRIRHASRSAKPARTPPPTDDSDPLVDLLVEILD